MKNAIFFSLISILLFSFKAPDAIKWHSLTEGLEIARRENKPILIFIYVNWCDKCQRMDKKVFTSKEVMPLINDNFIAVKINPEVDSVYFKSDKVLKRKVFIGEIKPGQLAVSVPTTVFYREKDDKNVIMNGLQDPPELKENIEKFLKK
jgi:thioredoxin-related protein